MDINSKEIGKIAEALSKAQLSFGKASKKSSNPFFKAFFADMESVVDACQIQLSEHGLSFTSSAMMIETQHFLVGTLMHTSGEWLRTFVPLFFKGDMQSYGSALTYSRRYALASLCNVVTQDDDGEAAVDRITENQAKIFEGMLEQLKDPSLKEKIFKHLDIKETKFMTKTQFDNTIRNLRSKIDEKKPKDTEPTGTPRNGVSV